ncbi:MAG: 6-carboxytetrahydropterin synthase [Phycisphaerales bacterium JB063]
MLELTRTVRFCLTGDADELDTPRDNTFASWPPMRGLGRYYELRVTCRGEADPQTGYFINIKQIDTATREHALPLLREAVQHEARAADTPMGTLLARLLDAVQPPLSNTAHRLALILTPTLHYAIEQDDMAQLTLSQQYDFSAAHRLHVPALSDDENRATFGKCNNPAGHGHNYRLEVVARCTIADDGTTLDPAALDAAVNQHVIEPLDHKHLNHDVPAFADRNPSVEHIAQTIWAMLADHMPPGSALDALTVWETEKTACTYRGA